MFIPQHPAFFIPQESWVISTADLLVFLLHNRKTFINHLNFSFQERYSLPKWSGFFSKVPEKGIGVHPSIPPIRLVKRYWKFSGNRESLVSFVYLMWSCRIALPQGPSLNYFLSTVKTHKIERGGMASYFKFAIRKMEER